MSLTKIMYQQVLDGGEVGASAFAETIIGASHPLETYNASDFHPPPYNPSANVDHQHHFPRFGHTNNFDALVEGVTRQSSSSTSTDYIVGVCAGAMLIFGVALLWGMVIIGLKIAGQKRVGFLAGRLEHPGCSNEASDSGTLPAIPEEGAEEGEDDEAGESNLGGNGGSALDSSLTAPLVISNNIMEGARAEAKFKRKVRAVRIAFFISGLGVIVSGALFYAKGIVAFERSLDTMHQGIVMVQLTANQAINVTETVVRDKDALIEDFQQTKRNTTGVLCEGDGEIAEQIQGHVAEFASALEDLNAEVNDNLNLFADDLRHLIQIAEDVDDGLNNAEILFYVALSLSILLLLLIVSMMAVAVFSARDIANSNCCTTFLTNAILWPLFVVLLVLFWIFSLLFLVSSLAGADFCVNPDSVMTGLLYQYQAQFHSAIFEFVLYYVSGCQVVPSSQSEINDIVSTIKDVLHTVHELSETVMGLSLPALESECGLDSAGASALQGGAELMHEATHAVNRAMIGVRTVLECKTFNPIYTTFVHDAICVDAVDGLTWIFSTSFFIFAFAMLMVMFRAALYPVKRPTMQSESVGLSASLLSK